MPVTRENEKRARKEGARRGTGGQWKGSEDTRRPVLGFCCGSAIVKVSERGGQCGHCDRLGLRLIKVSLTV